MVITGDLLYKDKSYGYAGSPLRVSQQHYYTRKLPFGYPRNPTVRAVAYGNPSSPTVQGQYPIGIPVALPYKYSILWVSQQPYSTKRVPYAYLSSPTGQYPMGIPAALLNKDSTHWVFQQP